MKTKLHLMAINAHAGDEIAAGAGLLLHTRRGHQATIVHLTLGERGHPRLSEEEYRKQKIEEAKKVADALGAEVHFFPYKDGELEANQETKLAVADLIREIRPTHIITHWPGSIHKDHTAAFQIVKEAIFYAALPSIVRKYPSHQVEGPFLTENWEDDINYVPQIFLDITPVYHEWLEAVSQYQLYRGGISDFDYLGYYTALARHRGVMAGCMYAITFGLTCPPKVYLSKGFDQTIRLYTSSSPVFHPQLKKDTVG
jgi:LmbE family N-acetylglucosaminyl deacetylase